MEQEQFNAACQTQSEIAEIKKHLENLKEIKKLADGGHTPTITLKACNRFPDLIMIDPIETLDMEIYRCEKRIEQLENIFKKL